MDTLEHDESANLPSMDESVGILVADDKFWLPKNMTRPANSKLFLLDAKNRGEMYHYRAAMQVVQYPVLIYNYKSKYDDLVNYVKHVDPTDKRSIFVAACSKKILTNMNKKPTNAELGDSKLYHGNDNGEEVKTDALEQVSMAGKLLAARDATDIIAKAIPDKEKRKDIHDGMVRLDDEVKVKLVKVFKTIFDKVWVANKPPTILGVYRKTGTEWSDIDKEGGIYPELDTGEGLKEIDDILDRIAKETKKTKIRLVAAGNKTDAEVNHLPNIGEYWLKFKNVAPKTLSRDAEAYYMQWLFEQSYYSMAVGYRSGALDLFTFLDIPTVSISLRNLNGEIRHGLLAVEGTKRYNVQYDRPRHIVTSYYPPSGNARDQLNSPFWLSPAPRDRELDRRRHEKWDDTKKKAEQTTPPIALDKFDNRVLELGVSLATKAHMGVTDRFVAILAPGKPDMGNPPPDTPYIINTHKTRYYYPVEYKGKQKQLKDYFTAHEKLDRSALDDMNIEKKRLQYQESPDVYTSQYKKPSDADWRRIKQALPK